MIIHQQGRDIAFLRALWKWKMDLAERDRRKKTVERLLSELSRSLETLTEREARILKLRFGLDGDNPHTLQAIGDIFHVTRERIRIIEGRALLKLTMEL